VSAVDVVLDHRCLLGEGPVWDEREQKLLFVDILRGSVFRFDPGDGGLEEFAVGEAVGALAPRLSGGLVLATARGFSTLDLDSGHVGPLAILDDSLRGGRMNDGKCDPVGRFWAGTQSAVMGERRAALFRLDGDGSVTRVLQSVGISNGLDWSDDGRTLYYVDTVTARVDTFRFDAGRGTLADRRMFVEVPAEQGEPDGIALDEEGGLWVALFGGSAVHRYASDGSLDAVIRLPASLVTSCAFGGPELEDLYVTTAAHRLERAEPEAGALFRFRPGVRGRPTRRFAG
jgi:sugar lactone lactonase YvrE